MSGVAEPGAARDAYRVLVISADERLRQDLQAGLETGGLQVSFAVDLESALESHRALEPQLLIVDLSLREQAGWIVCAMVRRGRTGGAAAVGAAVGAEVGETAERVPAVIMLLSAAEPWSDQAEAEQLQGFATGADDFVTRPISAPVVARRAMAHLRRVYSYDRAGGHAPAGVPVSLNAGCQG